MVVLKGELADLTSPAWSEVGRCTIDQAMDVLGTRTAMVIMREASYGTTRFDDFVRRVGASRAATAARLTELVDFGLLERRRYQDPGQRARDEYALTASGNDLMPAIWALFEWGRKHLENDIRLRITHDGCGAPAHTAIVCEHGHEVAPDALAVGLP